MENPEFENLTTLLDSENEEAYNLGLILAKNYRPEFMDYYGCEVEEFEEIMIFLKKNKVYGFGFPLITTHRLLLAARSIKEIPKSIYVLRNLKILDLCFNYLGKMPMEIVNIENLRFLDLTSNRLEVLPKEIAKLKKLYSLILKFNMFSEFPMEVLKLKNLENLCLQHNQLQSIPPEIKKLKKLETLNLKNNYIGSLPEELCELKNLKEVYIYGNRKDIIIPPKLKEKRVIVYSE